MKKLLRIIREINNYIFLLRQIKKYKTEDKWSEMKYPLRVNWIGAIYTVINLPPEVFNAEKIFIKDYIVAESKRVDGYLASINIAEIIYKRTKKVKIPNSEAYLIKYNPLFRDLTVGWLIKMLLLILGLIFIENKLNIIDGLLSVYNYFSILIS